MPSYISDRRLYLTADGEEVVEDGDPRAAFLLVAEGREIDAPEVERLNISQDEDGRISYPGEGGRSKAVPAPENKMVEKAEDKGEDRSDMTKPELVALAEERGIEVERADGKDGAPLVSDYLRALGS